MMTDVDAPFSLAEQRRRILDEFSSAAALLGVPLCLYQVYINATVARWDLVLMNTVVPLALAAIALSRRAPFKVRATAFCALLSFAAAVTWLLVGFALEPAALHIVAVLATTMLLGLRRGLQSLALVSLALAAGATGHLLDVLPTDAQVRLFGDSIHNWVGGGMAIVFVALALAIGIANLFRGLESGRRGAVSLVHRLRDEAQARIAGEAERLRMETQLVHAQRRDAMADLAGGVAHDFNNLLTVMFGALDLASHELPTDSRARPFVQDAKHAAQSGADLARQLLALSRGDPRARKASALGPVVQETLSLARRLLPPKIAVNSEIAPDLPLVDMAPANLQQVLLNLVINARDAMPEGGTLTVSLVREQGGDGIVLRVQDTGLGMDEATSKRAFDPLFTTKPEGKGTGLGLAVVAKIVRDAGGYVQLATAPGQGATFTLTLPESTRGPTTSVSVVGPAPAPDRSARILVVEDNPSILNMVVAVLGAAGHEVTACASVAQAREALAKNAAPHLFLIDVMLPGESGAEFAYELASRGPPALIVLMTGYAAEDRAAELLASGAVGLLAKPFTPQALLATVDNLLKNGMGENA